MKRLYTPEGKRVHNSRPGVNWLYKPFNGEFPTRVQWVVVEGKTRHGYYGKPSAQIFNRFARLLARPGIVYAKIEEFDAASALWYGQWTKGNPGDPRQLLRVPAARVAHQRKVYAYYPELGGQQCYQAWLRPGNFVPFKQVDGICLHGRVQVCYFSSVQQADNPGWKRELATNAQELQRQHPWVVRQKRQIVEFPREVPLALNFQQLAVQQAADNFRLQAPAIWVQYNNVPAPVQPIPAPVEWPWNLE